VKWAKLFNEYIDYQIFGRIDDDGTMRVTCSEKHPEFVAWLSEGNIPEELDINDFGNNTDVQHQA